MEHWQDILTFTDLHKEGCLSQPMSIESLGDEMNNCINLQNKPINTLPPKSFEKGRPVQEIEEKYRHIFQYENFNFIQSKVFNDTLYSDKSVVVSAPTGTGKTVVFELAIIRLLMNIEKLGYKGDYKIVYMAPVKALCTERLTDWYAKFTRLGLLCVEVTGDTDVDFTYLKPYRIIITTPEKWDMLTRRWTNNKSLVEVIKLFMIDEVHLLNEDGRGPVLEAVVSRMKTIEALTQSTRSLKKIQSQEESKNFIGETTLSLKIRFLAVSATIPNPEDVAEWLGTPEVPALYYKFDDDCRPVKLKTIVEGYPCSEGLSVFKFDLLLNYKLWPIIEKYSKGRPTMIFCSTRKSVVMTAGFLSHELSFIFHDNQRIKLCELAAKIHDKKLQAYVLSGIGCHHAGYIYQERLSIEEAFRKGDLPILVTTTTLAMGVNLPAHLVIIKSTQQYVNGAYQEYNMSSVLQMMGRAGRPQFDTEATAVIMTRQQDRHRYERALSRLEPLESRLGGRLAEHFNSEVALGSITDLALAVHWARSTFLYVRARRHARSARHIEDMCLKAMNGLANTGMITFDDTMCVSPTEAGRLMATFYLDLHTMKLILKVKGDENLETLLDLVCQSHEMTEVRLRMGERQCLNLLNRKKAGVTIRFPMKGRITTGEMKVKCLVQAVLGCVNIPDPSLGQESVKIMRIGERIIKCLVMYITRSQFFDQKPCFFNTILNAHILLKCFHAKLWDNSPFVTRQLKGIGPAFSTLLAAAGKTTFKSIRDNNPRDLERIMNKGPPMGNTLKSQVMLLPQYQLTLLHHIAYQVDLVLTLNNIQHLKENIYDLTAGEKHKVVLLVGDSNNNLLFIASVRDCELINMHNGTFKTTINLNVNTGDITAFCISSTFVGFDTNTSLSLSSNINDLEKLQSPRTNYIIPSKVPKTEKDAKNSFKNQNKSGQLSSTIPNYFLIKKRPYMESDASTFKKQKKCSFSKSNEVYQEIIKDKRYDSVINLDPQNNNLTLAKNISRKYTDGHITVKVTENRDKCINLTSDEGTDKNEKYDITHDDFNDVLCNLENKKVTKNRGAKYINLTSDEGPGKNVNNDITDNDFNDVLCNLENKKFTKNHDEKCINLTSDVGPGINMNSDITENDFNDMLCNLENENVTENRGDKCINMTSYEGPGKNVNNDIIDDDFNDMLCNLLNKKVTENRGVKCINLISDKGPGVNVNKAITDDDFNDMLCNLENEKVTKNHGDKCINLTSDEGPGINVNNGITDDDFNDMLCNLENEMQCHNSTSKVCQLTPILEKSGYEKEKNTEKLKKFNCQFNTRVNMKQYVIRDVQSDNEQSKYIPTRLHTDHNSLASANKKSDKNYYTINNILKNSIYQSDYAMKSQAYNEIHQTGKILKNNYLLDLEPKISIPNKFKYTGSIVNKKKVSKHGWNKHSSPILDTNGKQKRNKKPAEDMYQNKTIIGNKYLLVPTHVNSNRSTLIKSRSDEITNGKFMSIIDSSKPSIKITVYERDSECNRLCGQNICMKGKSDVMKIYPSYKYQVTRILSPLKKPMLPASQGLHTVETKCNHNVSPEKNFTLDIQMLLNDSNFTINSGRIFDVTKQAFTFLRSLSVCNKDLKAISELLHGKDILNICTINNLHNQTNKSKMIVKDNLDKPNNKCQILQPITSPQKKNSFTEIPICRQIFNSNSIANIKLNSRIDISSQFINNVKKKFSIPQNLSPLEANLISVSVPTDTLKENKTISIIEHPVLSYANKCLHNTKLLSLNKTCEYSLNKTVSTKSILSINETDHFNPSNSHGITLENTLRQNKSNVNSKVLDSQNSIKEVSNIEPKCLRSTNINDCSETSSEIYTNCISDNKIKGINTLPLSSNMYSPKTSVKNCYKDGLQKSNNMIGISFNYGKKGKNGVKSEEKIDEAKTKNENVDLPFDKKYKCNDIISILDKYKLYFTHNSKARSSQNTNIKTHAPFKVINENKKYSKIKRPFRIQTLSDPNVSLFTPKESDNNLKNYMNFFENKQFLKNPHDMFISNEHEPVEDPMDLALSQVSEETSLNMDLLNPKFVLSHSTGDDSVTQEHLVQHDLPNNSHCTLNKETNFETNVASSLKLIFKQNCNLNDDTDYDQNISNDQNRSKYKNSVC